MTTSRRRAPEIVRVIPRSRATLSRVRSSGRRHRSSDRRHPARRAIEFSVQPRDELQRLKSGSGGYQCSITASRLIAAREEALRRRACTCLYPCARVRPVCAVLLAAARERHRQLGEGPPSACRSRSCSTSRPTRGYPARIRDVGGADRASQIGIPRA